MIQAQNLTLTYPDGTVSINDITFSLEEGEDTALIGANGAGKSTLLLGLAGVLTAPEGALFIRGISCVKKNLSLIRRELGLVFQNPDDQLFMATIREDLEFGPANYGIQKEETQKRIEEVLSRLGMEGLQEKTAQKLSGGEKRLAAIATVLVMEPSIMLLDEPSSFLDPANRRNLIRLLSGLPQTKLIATHDLDLALELCPRVILLKAGRILADGKGEELLRDENLLQSCGLELPLSLAGTKGKCIKK